MRPRLLLPALGLLLALVLPSFAQIPPQDRREWTFPGVTFSNQFSGARLTSVESGDTPHAFTLTIDREGPGVRNNSGWYGFDVRADTETTLHLTLTYPWGSHRFTPHLSHDEGLTWSRLTEPVETTHQRKVATFPVTVGPRPLRIAAAEAITVAQMEAWSEGLAARPDITQRVFGQSVAGRPLHVLHSTATRPSDTTKTLLVMTYQHPPEHTGGLGFQVFMERIWGDTPLARAFRERHHVVAVPLANPDGVHEGHWRNNLGDIDLNRDWINFSQPETQALRALFKSIRDPLVFLDLHSTFKDVFYTDPDGLTGPPDDFIKTWTDNLQKAHPRRPLPRETSHNPTSATSRRWATAELGVAAITWEFAYSSDREWITTFATSGADELMRYFLR